MHKYSIFFTQHAKKDISDIVKYIKNDLKDINSARRLSNKIKSQVELLSTFPYQYSLVRDEELALKGIRRFNVDHFAIFYQCNTEHQHVIILRILYNKREWNELI